MLKINATTKRLLIFLLVVLIAVVGYGLITRCDNVAIYSYCETENHQFGR